MKWKRYRFATASEDFRPVIYPPPGPWWCSGYSGNTAILIAFLPADVDLKVYWPEVEGISSVEDRDELTFTDRFPEPDWWRDLKREDISR